MQTPPPPGQPKLMCTPLLLLYPKCLRSAEPGFA